ncbi:hypothetical protein OH492_17510 [Vibrio chagasii]|nr:hypothetical protein [Vibrio chagasii]
MSCKDSKQCTCKVKYFIHQLYKSSLNIIALIFIILLINIQTLGNIYANKIIKSLPLLLTACFMVSLTVRVDGETRDDDFLKTWKISRDCEW